MNDSLPKYICTDCLQKLKMTMDFKKECENSERKFKKILNPQGESLTNLSIAFQVLLKIEDTYTLNIGCLSACPSAFVVCMP